MGSTASSHRGVSPTSFGLRSAQAVVLALLFAFAGSAALAGDFNGPPAGSDFSSTKQIAKNGPITVLLGKVVTKNGPVDAALRREVEDLGGALAKKYKRYLKKHPGLGTFDVVIIAHYKEGGTNTFVHKAMGPAKPFGAKLAGVFTNHATTLGATAGQDMTVRIPLRIIGP
jgi:hypothetical protein